MANYGERVAAIIKNDNINERLQKRKEERERSLTSNVACYSKASYLVEKFEKIGYPDAKNSYDFFVKCFKLLSEDTIWDIYERAVNNPLVESKIKYFIAACRNQIGRL